MLRQLRLKPDPTSVLQFVAVAALAAALVVSAGQAPATAQGKLRIKLATLAPRDSSYHRLLLEMGEKWRADSGGLVDVTIYAGGNQGSEAESVTRMRVGQLQAGMLSTGGLMEIDEGVAALQLIPMLFHSLDEEEWVRDRLRPDLEKRLAAKGFVSLFWGDSGWVHLFSRTAALRPGDFKNMKLFVTASSSTREADIMQALGYRPVSLPWSEVLLQMQSGGVDAVPCPPIIALSGQYYTAARHMTKVNWLPLVGATVVTRQAWDAVPEPLRAKLLQTATETGKKIQEASRRESEQAVATMQTMKTASLRIEVHETTPEVENEWRVFAESIYPRIRGTLVPADVFDRSRQLVAQYRASQGNSR